MGIPAAELAGGDRFVDLEADSLALIEIVEVAEDRLRSAGMSVRVDDGTLASLTTLAELVTALRNEAES
jgi:acyl carrier protein